MKREYYYECTFREKRDYHNTNIIYDNFTNGNDRYAVGICKIKPVIDFRNYIQYYMYVYVTVYKDIYIYMSNFRQ